ncbi:MAG: glycosyltransferase family 9 protein [Puniceicoccaceae bacterium]
MSRPDRLGDLVISTSVLRPLRLAFPEARIGMLVDRGLRDLLRGHPGIDCLMSTLPFRRKDGLIQQLAAYRRRLRRENPDAMVHLQPNPVLHAAALLAGIPVRVGYRKKGGRLWLNRTLPDRRHLGLKHEAAHNFDLLELIGVEAPRSPEPWIEGSFPSLSELSASRGWSWAANGYAVLHPGAWGNKPRWPAVAYGKLAGALVEKHRLQVVIAGGGKEAESVTEIREAAGCAGRHLIDLCGVTTLEDLVVLLRDARLVVARDTGPAHLAAALGTATIILMGQCDPIHSPRRWSPLGKRALTVARDLARIGGESREERWSRCFSAITVEEVLSAASHLKAI